jgi:L-histidine Nalpha-methyltransferase
LPLELELQLVDVPRLLLYLGSSIGNFAPAQAEQFLRAAHATAGPGGALIIGVDLVKSPHCLQAAYDDALGITAAFNRNVLNRVNRLVGTDFNLADWQHVAFFDAQQCCVQMHLRPRRAMVPVHWPGGGRVFSVSEGIHTENAYKYSVDGFGALLQRAGWTVRDTLVDSASDSVGHSESETVGHSRMNSLGASTGSGAPGGEAGYAVFIAHA